MSAAPSRAHSEVFSASQYGGPQPVRPILNFFIVPSFIAHIVGLACLWALWYYLRLTTVFPYHHRVFYCRDINLYKPNFRPEDFNVYVSYDLLYVLGFCLPPLVLLLGEIAFWMFSTKPRKTVYATCGECKVHLFTRRLFRFVGVFMFGALIVQIFVDTIKLMTGYQRPYFLSLCNISIRYAWLTFPSLHAAFSSYSACFASCYIYYMINLRGAPLLRPFLIFGFLGLCLVDSFSRINGYKNHWRDIWVGWLIGFAAAYFLCHCVLCFQEVYHIAIEKAPLIQEVEERAPPFFQWFRLPRVQAPSVKEDYVVYEEDVPQVGTQPRHRRNADRTYEVTTTTESFHRTISPPQQHNSAQQYQY